MKMAQNRLQSALQRALMLERQKQLLGLSDEAGTLKTVELVEQIAKWWRENVLGPAAAIAGNPAASCAEARVAIQAVLGLMRQRQLLGMTPDKNDHSEEAEKARAEEAELEKLFSAVWNSVRQRCREEALDECVATGRFKAVTEWALGEERQSQLLGLGGESGVDAWAIDALGQCAIYELHFVSTAKVEGSFKLDTVLDGKIKLKFKLDEGGLLDSPSLEGEVKSATNPFLVSIKCETEGAQMTCSPTAIVTAPFKARIKTMDLKHREFYVDANDVSKERIVGEDKLSLEFSGAVVMTTAVISVPGAGSMTTTVEAGWTAFRIAHRKDRRDEIFTFERDKRGVYPTVFEFTYADRDQEEGTTASDSTVFELVHKPGPKPFPTRPPEPPRKPLIPRARSSG